MSGERGTAALAAAMAEADGVLLTGPAARAARLQRLRPKLTRLDHDQLAEVERAVDALIHFAEAGEPMPALAIASRGGHHER